MTFFEGPGAFTFLHHFLMSYLITSFSRKDCPFSHHLLGCEKEVSTLMAISTTYLLCQKELVRICFPLTYRHFWLAILSGFSSPVHTEVISRSTFEYKDLFLYQLPGFILPVEKTSNSPGLIIRTICSLHSPQEEGASRMHLCV